VSHSIRPGIQAQAGPLVLLFPGRAELDSKACIARAWPNHDHVLDWNQTSIKFLSSVYLILFRSQVELEFIIKLNNNLFFERTGTCSQV
jgi:hypothetical protein